MASLSVVTLTNTRIERLKLLLDTLLPQFELGDEIIVIDTGSRDETRDYLAQLNEPAVRHFFYDDPGSWAEVRNFGVRQARGAMIAFLDDDCLPCKDWTVRGKAGLQQADAVGGIARPLGIKQFPAWWHPEMGWMVGLSIPGQVGPDAGRIHYPFTANLWVRRSVGLAEPFQELGGSLDGHSAALYIAGREDAQWWRRLRTGGYRTRMDPLLWVGHAIDPARINLDYLRSRAMRDGEAWARREGRPDDLSPLAYQWWRQLFRQWSAVFSEPEAFACTWHYHGLVRRRHGRAIHTLASKTTGDRAAKAYLHGLVYRLRGLLHWGKDQGRTLVRHLGKPWFRAYPRRRMIKPPHRLAVVAFGYLGDLFILRSVLGGLLENHSKLQIDVVATRPGDLALSDLPRTSVTTVPELDTCRPEAKRWLRRWLHAARPDAIAVAYMHEPWGPVLASIMRPPRPLVGFAGDSGLSHRRYLERLSFKVHKDLRFHESQNLCALFKAVGLDAKPWLRRFNPPGEACAAIEKNPWLHEAARSGDPLIAMNPEAGTPYKVWTDEGWAALIERVLAQSTARIMINASLPRPQFEALIKGRVGESARDRIHWLRQTPLDELVAWLNHADLLVTVDAGPQHIAHALDLASLTLYGPMDERRWADYHQRPHHRTIRACTPDLLPEEKRGLAPNHEVALISPERVFAELMELLAFVQYGGDRAYAPTLDESDPG